MHDELKIMNVGLESRIESGTVSQKYNATRSALPFGNQSPCSCYTNPVVDNGDFVVFINESSLGIDAANLFCKNCLRQHTHNMFL